MEQEQTVNLCASAQLGPNPRLPTSEEAMTNLKDLALEILRLEKRSDVLDQIGMYYSRYYWACNDVKWKEIDTQKLKDEFVENVSKLLRA